MAFYSEQGCFVTRTAQNMLPVIESEEKKYGLNNKIK